MTINKWQKVDPLLKNSLTVLNKETLNVKALIFNQSNYFTHSFRETFGIKQEPPYLVYEQKISCF